MGNDECLNNPQGCSDTNIAFCTSPNCKGSNLHKSVTSAGSAVTWSKTYLQHLRERETLRGLGPELGDS